MWKKGRMILLFLLAATLLVTLLPLAGLAEGNEKEYTLTETTDGILKIQPKVGQDAKPLTDKEKAVVYVYKKAVKAEGDAVVEDVVIEEVELEPEDPAGETKENPYKDVVYKGKLYTKDEVSKSTA